MDNQQASLQKQLTNAKDHLLLIQERNSGYVDPNNIPLEQGSNERHWKKRFSI